MLRRYLPTLLCFSLIVTSAIAQPALEVINEDPYTPLELIENTFLGEGIEVLNVTYTGDDRSAAYFRNGGASIGLERGVVLTTGITVAQGTLAGVEGIGNQSASVNNTSPLDADLDLRAIIGNTTTPIRDVSVYEITFRPLTDSVSFRYVFASEEYPEYVCSRYNDLFGFFISGPGINGPYTNNAENIARIPGTDLPVRINTVNSGMEGSNSLPGGCDPPAGSLDHSEFYVDNYNSGLQPVFDGYTQIFTAASAVEACEVYTIKIIIADVGDPNLDSGVFLEARSFGGKSTNLEIVNLSIDGSMAEGCRPAELHFYTSQPVEQDLPLTVDFFGQATPGVDYTLPPANLTIPAGDSLLIVPIEAFEDGIDDPAEYIYISLLRSACFTDTFQIRIEDNRLQSIELDDQLIVCGGETVELNATVAGAEPEIFTFSNPDDVDLVFSLTNPWRSSFIDVSGVVPDQLSAEVFESVCITNLEHGRPAQVDVFLYNPNGVPVELTTDNGGNGGGGPFEGYLNTCFTPAAVNPITGPGNQAPASMVPFTGDWRSEGELSDLWLGNQPTNGQWELRVRDDAAFTNGTLSEWSISFRRPYGIEYAWEAGANLDCYDCPNPQLVADTEGFVNLTVTDTYGCSLEDSIEVVFQPTPPLSLAPGCLAGTDSTLLINWGSAEDAAYYEVSTEDGGWIPVGQDTTYLFQNLVADSNYVFYVRPVFNDCLGPEQAVSCQTFSCDEDLPVISAQATDALCFGQANGSVELSAEGLYPPFRYLLDGVVQSGPQIGDLAAGAYAAVVVDGRGCADSTLIEVSEPPALDNTTTVDGQIGCNTTASLTAVVSGGTQPYAYAWNGVAGSDVLTGISSGGNYVLFVSDGNGCILTDTTTLVGPAALAFTANSTPAACSNVNDGSISLSPSGGISPYQYSWENGVAGNVPLAQDLPAGVYRVTITDATGCSESREIAVTRGPDVLLGGTSEVARCFGESNGSISVQVDNGNAPFDFAWSEPGLSGPAPDGLPAGNYELTVTDARGCLADTSFVVGEPDPLVTSLTEANDPQCAGDQNGSIQVELSGGTLPYTYAWSNGLASNNLDNLAAGNYELVATDANGCQLTRSFTLEEPAPLELSSLTTDNRCAGDANGIASILASATLESEAYYWPELGVRGPVQDNLAAGDYLVRVTNALGCVTETTVSVNEPPALTLEPVVENVRCHGETSGLIELPATGGTPGYRYRIDGLEWQNSNVFLGLAADDYTATVRDANGCELTLDELNVLEPEPFGITLGERQTIRYGDSLQLFATPSGGFLPILDYRWSPVDSSLFSCLSCPEPWFKPLEQTTVRLRALDQGGCLAEAVVTVIVEKDFPVRVPTGFTPNDDGANDRLIVHGLPGIIIRRFQVFDRWGEVVFENGDFPTNEAAAGWDGNFRGSPLNANVFIWQLEAVFPDGKTQHFYGQTSLIR